MKNVDSWRPTKFVYKNGKLRASRDPKQVGIGSRVIADSVARLYGEYLPKYVRGRLIDLGCGRVPLFEAYRELTTDHVCADWGNTLHKNDHLDVECDLTQPLPFETADFDTVILSDVLEHIPEPSALWAEMARILRPGGRVIMNVPFYYWIHEQPFDFYRYTEFALRRFATSAGFSVELLTPVGGVPEILADIVSKVCLEVPRIGATSAAIVQASASAFLGTSFGRRVSGATQDQFPLGYFMVAQRGV